MIWGKGKNFKAMYLSGLKSNFVDYMDLWLKEYIYFGTTSLGKR